MNILENRTYILLGGIVLVVATVAATRYLWPAVELRVETKEVIKNNVVTVIKTVKVGDREETTTIITDKTVKKDTSLTLVSAKPQWRISGGLDSYGHYYGHLDRRVLGPAFISLGADSGGAVRFGVGIEF
jgi:hypothetical protein